MAAAAKADVKEVKSTPTLYGHMMSTAARGVIHYIKEFNLPVDIKIIDIMNKQHQTDEYKKINPCQKVPAFKDGDFTLSESAAIIKYIAEVYGKEAHYPKDVKTRSLLASRIETISTDVTRQFLYSFVYPQLGFAKRPDDDLQKFVVTYGKANSLRQFAAVDRDIIGDRKYIGGDNITIADFHALSILWSAKIVHADLSAFKNLSGWFKRMESTTSFAEVYGGTMGWAQTLRNKVVGWDAKEAQAAVDAYAHEFKGSQACSDAKKYAPKATPVVYGVTISNVARGVEQYIKHANLKDVEWVEVNMFANEHKSTEYRANCHSKGLVPAYREGDFVLTESSVILKYLALRHNCSCYPANDPKGRARVNEIMSFFNTTFYSLLGYHIAYPQTFALPEWGANAAKEAAYALPLFQRELEYLDAHFLAGKQFLMGDKPGIADFFGWSVIGTGALIGCDFGDYPNISKWLGNMSRLPTSEPLMKAVEGFAGKEIWGKRADKVALRPSNDKFVRIWHMPLVGGDEEKHRKFVEERVHTLRGIRGTRSVTSAIDAANKTAITIVVWQNKRSWVAHVNSDSYAKMTTNPPPGVDPSKIVYTSATLIDV
jgi:glutathione S-transferase